MALLLLDFPIIFLFDVFPKLEDIILPDNTQATYVVMGILGTLLYLGFGLLLGKTIVAVRRLMRRRRRIGMCLSCGYDLTGNVSGTCSECGTRIQEGVTNEYDT